MLSIVIADDKPAARRGLENIIDWRAEGVEVVATAEDGKQTLDQCLERKPDILLTDIKMPFLSGLDVARRVREAGLATRTIVVSGIADFEFARDAIEVDAEGYLLKPVKVMELTALVRRVVASIYRERRQREAVAALRERYREYVPVLRTSFLKELVEGVPTQTDDAAVREHVAAFSVPLDPDGPAIACVVQPEEASELAAEERQIRRLSLTQLLETEFQDEAAVVFRSRSTEITVIYQWNDREHSTDSLVRRLETLQRDSRDVVGLSFSAGVGTPVPRLREVHNSYQEAQQAVQHRIYAGESAIIGYGSLDTQPRDSGLRSREAFSTEIQRAVEVGDVSELPRLLDEFFRSFARESPRLLQRAQVASAALLLGIMQSVMDDAATGPEVDAEQVFPAVFGAENTYNLRQYVGGVLERLTQHFASKYTQQRERLVDRVKQYVAEHFGDDLSMQDIADYVAYTPNYISLVFSRSTGRTVKEYITGVRVEHAKRLLRTTNRMILDIASECGYDAHYFSTVFRKETGMTPKQYRDSQNG